MYIYSSFMMFFFLRKISREGFFFYKFFLRKRKYERSTGVGQKIFFFNRRGKIASFEKFQELYLSQYHKESDDNEYIFRVFDAEPLAFIFNYNRFHLTDDCYDRELNDYLLDIFVFSCENYSENNYVYEKSRDRDKYNITKTEKFFMALNFPPKSFFLCVRFDVRFYYKVQNKGEKRLQFERVGSRSRRTRELLNICRGVANQVYMLFDLQFKSDTVSRLLNRDEIILEFKNRLSDLGIDFKPTYLRDFKYFNVEYRNRIYKKKKVLNTKQFRGCWEKQYIKYYKKFFFNYFLRFKESLFFIFTWDFKLFLFLLQNFTIRDFFRVEFFSYCFRRYILNDGFLDVRFCILPTYAINFFNYFFFFNNLKFFFLFDFNFLSDFFFSSSFFKVDIFNLLFMIFSSNKKLNFKRFRCIWYLTFYYFISSTLVYLSIDCFFNDKYLRLFVSYFFFKVDFFEFFVEFFRVEQLILLDFFSFFCYGKNRKLFKSKYFLIPIKNEVFSISQGFFFFNFISYFDFFLINFCINWIKKFIKFSYLTVKFNEFDFYALKIASYLVLFNNLFTILEDFILVKVFFYYSDIIYFIELRGFEDFLNHLLHIAKPPFKILWIFLYKFQLSSNSYLDDFYCFFFYLCIYIPNILNFLEPITFFLFITIKIFKRLVIFIQNLFFKHRISQYGINGYYILEAVSPFLEFYDEILGIFSIIILNLNSTYNFSFFFLKNFFFVFYSNIFFLNLSILNNYISEFLNFFSFFFQMRKGYYFYRYNFLIKKSSNGFVLLIFNNLSQLWFSKYFNIGCSLRINYYFFYNDFIFKKFRVSKILEDNSKIFFENFFWFLNFLNIKNYLFFFANSLPMFKCSILSYRFFFLNIYFNVCWNKFIIRFLSADLILNYYYIESNSIFPFNWKLFNFYNVKLFVKSNFFVRFKNYDFPIDKVFLQEWEDFFIYLLQRWAVDNFEKTLFSEKFLKKKL